MAWIFESVDNLMNTLEEIVVPYNYSPLDCFKVHWNSIKEFYIDQKYDEETFQASEVPQHFVDMITILIEEQRSNKLDNEFQPCLEYFMKMKIFEVICKLCEVNKPNGVSKLLYQLITTLITDMPISLLPNMSFHQPLKQLIMNSKGEYSEFADLLIAILEEIKKRPEYSRFFIHETNNISQFIIFDCLLAHVKDEGYPGDKVKKSIFDCFQINDPVVTNYIHEHSAYQTVLTAELTASYSNLSKVKSDITCNEFVNFKKHLALCNDILRDVKHASVEKFINCIEKDFLLGLFSSHFLNLVSEKEALTATIYFSEMLDILDDRLLDLMFEFFFGYFENPETEDEVSEYISRSKIIKRIESESESLCLSTLKFFEKLITKYNRQIMYNLVLRNLIPRYHLSSLPNPKNLQQSVVAFLTFLPSNQLTATSAYEAYVADAHKNISTAKKFCSLWKPIPNLSMQEELSQNNQVNTHTSNNNNTNHSFHLPSENLSEDECVEKFFNGGLFIQTLLKKLRQTLSLSLDVNLVLTGILSKLAQYPFPVLYHFLLNKNLPVHSGIITLWNILNQLAQNIEKQSASMPNFKQSLEAARNSFVEDTPNSLSREKGTWTFLQAVVVLEEFSKELAAILATLSSAV